MHTNDLLATVEQLDTTDIDTLDRDELAATMADTALVRGWLDAIELRCARQGRKLADAGQAEPAPALIARHTNRTSRDADLIARRDRVAEAMPTFESGLGNGTVSASHLDAIAAATRNAPPEARAAFALHEDELLALAADDNIDTFTRRCRALVTELTTEHTGNDATELDRLRAASSIRTWLDHNDGLHHTHAALDPLRHDIFWTALNRSIKRRQQRDDNARTPWNQIQVDALIDTVTGSSGGASSDRTSCATAAPAAADVATEATPTAGSVPEPAPRPDAAIARDLIEAIDRSIGHSAAGDTTLDPPTGDPPDEPPAVHPATDPPAPGEATDADLRRIEARLPEIHVITDQRTLIDGLHEHSICETEDGNATARVHAAPALLRRPRHPDRARCRQRPTRRWARLSAPSPQANAGHSGRFIAPAATSTARCRSARPRSTTCSSGLETPARPTLPTSLPLCERCHHLVHEGGWTLTLTPDRIATWIRPDGTIHHHGPCSDRPPPTSSSP